MSASCRSRVRLEVSTTTGGCVARIVPELGDRHARPRPAARAGTPRSRRRRGRARRSAAPRAAGRDARSPRSSGPARCRYSRPNSSLLGERRRRAASASRIAQQLARVVPLVERLGGVDALVALQPDQRGAQRRAASALAASVLPTPGLALEQQRLRQAQRRGTAPSPGPRRRGSRRASSRARQRRRRRDGDRARLRARPRSRLTRSTRLVVLPGVDVARDRPGDRHLDDVVRAAVEQLPDAPCRRAARSSPNTARANANGWPRPSS